MTATRQAPASPVRAGVGVVTEVEWRTLRAAAKYKFHKSRELAFHSERLTDRSQWSAVRWRKLAALEERSARAWSDLMAAIADLPDDY